jgi:predicted acyl esterase
MGSSKRGSTQDPTPLEHHCVRVYPLPSDITVERDVPIRTADGTTLRANVYRPEGSERCPVLVSVTPYGKDAGVDDYPVNFDELAESGNFVGELELSDHTAFEAPDPGYWVPRGYAVVVADLRGCFASAGRPRLLLGRIAADAADVVVWAAEQSWSTGKVGMAGASHLATLQWYTAAQHPPHLAAFSPWEGITDPFRDTLSHGGIPETRFSDFWWRATQRGTRSPSTSIRKISPWLWRRFPDRCRHVVGPPPFADITVPALVGASWSDQGPRTRGSITGYSQLGSPDKWLYTHGRKTWQMFYGAEALDIQRRFFDHFLKGEDNGFDEVPHVRVETRHDLRTYSERHESQWPLPDTRYVPLHLDHAGGGLHSEQPAEETSVRMFPVAGDESVFTTTFDEDTEVTGHAALRLWVEAQDAKDMDLFVALKKIDPSGDEVRFEGHDGFEEGVVAHGWIRVSHRALDPEASTAYRPVIDPAAYWPLSAGQIVPVDIEIMPHSTFFEAGSSLALVITGHDFDALPDVRHDDTINKGFHIVHTGGRFDSHLLLPVVPTAVSADNATGTAAASDTPASLHDLPIAWGAVFGRQHVRL